MKRSFYLHLLFAAALLGQTREGPHHLFHPERALTAASNQAPRAIAESFLQRTASRYGLRDQDLQSLKLIKEYRTAHNGVTHLVYKQQFQGIEIYNAEYTVNIDSDGQVINAGGTLFPTRDAGAPPSLASAPAALKAAVRAISPKLGDAFSPLELETPNRGKSVRFFRSALGDDVQGTAAWYVYNGRLQPAWVFSILEADLVHSWEVVIDSDGELLLEQKPLTWFQQVQPPRGLVFETESPQTNPKPGVFQGSPFAYRERTLQSFRGDPTASPVGWVAGIETAGNNTITGENREAIFFLTTPKTAKSETRDFSFPLEVGPKAVSPVLFPDAVTTNLFYWVNKTHDLHYAAGFDEAAGNFQAQNFGRGGVEGDPLYAYSHFGITDTIFPDLDNAFFTARSTQDGAQSMIAMFLATFGGTMFTDGSLDSGVIVHEYTHGVSNRLVRQLGGAQGGAMGEAWSDFFGIEYTLPEGTPVDGTYPVGEYFSQAFGTGIRTRPYSTDLNANPLTFDRVGQVISRPEVHADGEIWMEAMWEARAALIRQFGEKEGRRRIRMLVMDGMKLSPPSPSFVDARDAILLADRTDFKGESQQQLWAAFARRGLGVLALSTSASTTHVAASFDTPNNLAQLGFYEKEYIQGETVRIVMYDNNFDKPTVTVDLTSSSGDVETIQLIRQGLIYTGSIPTSASTSAIRQDGTLALIPGDAISVYVTDFNPGQGQARQIQATVSTKGPYTASASNASFGFARETALGFRAAARSILRYDLPFDFNFFGRTYRSVRLLNNGLIVFEYPPAPTCIDAAGLAQYGAIAPLWMELRTNGVAQANEDVYVSRQSADSITFRWAAETAPPAATGVAPVPVNFAATLYQDGRVEFRYGDGNTDIAVPAANTSCGDSAPVVGISSGTGYVFSVGGYSRVSNLQNARTLLLRPASGFSSLPEGRLETPAAGSTVQGVLSGQGILYDRTLPVTAAYVLVDGVNVGRATLGVSRPDACTPTVNGCPNIGFTFSFDLAQLRIAPGTHTVQIRAVNAQYGFTDFPAQPVTITVGPGAGKLPVAVIETPITEAELSGRTPIRGYVYAEGLRITLADLLIDGVTYANLPLTVLRPDICGALTNVPNCPRIGFNVTLDTVAGTVLLPNGKHTLQVRVIDETGRTTITPETGVNITINNPDVKPPQGVLTTPKNNDTLSGVVRISGYAYDPGSTILGIQLVIDGEARATIPYGTARPQECAQLPDAAACPNIGFDLNFDTRVLTNGPHVLGVRVFSRSGQVSTIPGPVGGLSYGINVRVQN